MWDVPVDRVSKLPSHDFPKSGSLGDATAAPAVRPLLAATPLEEIRDQDAPNNPFQHGLIEDLAIVAFTVAHAMDVDENNQFAVRLMVCVPNARSAGQSEFRKRPFVVRIPAPGFHDSGTERRFFS